MVLSRLRRTATLALIVVAITACSAAPRSSNGPSAPASTRPPATQAATVPPSTAASSAMRPDGPIATQAPPVDTAPPLPTDPPTTEPPTTAPDPSPGLTEPFPYGEFANSTTID